MQNVPPGFNGDPNAYYEEEYGEEEHPVDEDGVPVPSPDEIKNVINAIPSFKYEEKKKSSSGNHPNE
jgi:hypothetical protein